MLMLVFKYCLPTVLGYILFVGITGSFQPYRRPERAADRPLWLLGLWSATVLVIALVTTSHFAYTMPFDQMNALLLPLLGGTLMALLAGGVIMLLHRRQVRRKRLDGPATPQRQGDSLAMPQPLASRTNADPARGFEPDREAADELSDEHADSRLPLVDMLGEEKALREETEKHLRITRKALSVLESQSRDHEASRADAMIGLEEELERQIRTAAEADARLQREAEKATSLECTLVDLKHELLEAKRNLRIGTEARAQALATAHKSLAQARRAVDGRQRTETRLAEMQAMLANRQQTITSLIERLDQEKNRTDDLVDERARHLLTHQRQLQARRAVEDAANHAEYRPGSRLIKRIAKARHASDDAGKAAT